MQKDPFHLITDIDATTGCTANQRAVLKSGENFLQDYVMLCWEKFFFPFRTFKVPAGNKACWVIRSK